jgi:serine/threonine protein kinase
MSAAVFGQIGDYKIIERIGYGGMGEVWLVNKVGFAGVTSAFVLKLLHVQHASDPKPREYFINEARLAAQLDHPNIVKVIDAGEADGRLYLIMERVDGCNLNAFLRYMRDADLALPLDLGITCYIIGEVLTGLVYAHGLTIAKRDAGIIHYDVTPNNILISSSGNVKLTDFGLSRVAAQAQNVSFIAGTPRYMSIEHHTATPRLASDIYGVGVVFHELVSNRKYHDGLEPKQIRDAILHGVVRPLGRDDLEPWLVQLITQMLAADYTQRPSARVALEIILRNVPGYRRAALEIAKIYQDVVGPACSGMTQFLNAVPERHRSFFGAPGEPHALIPASAATMGPTISTPPPMAAVKPDAPTTVESNTPQPAAPTEQPVEQLVEQPVEELVEPTEVLPGFSQPYLRADSNSAVIIAESAHAVSGPARTAGRRILLGLGISVGMIAFVGVGWVIGTFAKDEEEPEPEVVATKDEDPQPATVAKTEDREPTAAAEIEPSDAEIPEVDKPTEKDDPPVVKEPTSEGEGDGDGVSEPENGTETTPPTPPKSTTKPKKAVQPVMVVLFIKGYNGTGTIKLGTKEHAVQGGYVKIPKVAPGTYTAKWRTGDSDPWQDAGKIVVEAIAPDYYQFRLGKGTADRTITKGKGK